MSITLHLIDDKNKSENKIENKLKNSFLLCLLLDLNNSTIEVMTS